MSYTLYPHHGQEVWVRSDLQGKHRQYCLCYNCSKFNPDQPDNCLIAFRLYEISKANAIVTPVWECPMFEAIYPSLMPLNECPPLKMDRREVALIEFCMHYMKNPFGFPMHNIMVVVAKLYNYIVENFGQPMFELDEPKK
jgi:hypothetical protein